MLEIIVPAIEYWDEKNELFVPKTKEQTTISLLRVNLGYS